MMVNVKRTASTNKEQQNIQQLNAPVEEENMPMQQSQLTQFRDTGILATQSIKTDPGRILGKIANPFPTQTPTQLLSRNYKVAEFTWGPAAASHTLDFPGSLLAIPNIQKALSSFKWMRSGIKLETKINATQFHYGALLVSWLPNDRISAHGEDVVQQSGNHPIVLSAAQQSSCTFSIPWINPYNYFIIQQGAGYATSEIAKVYFSQLTPLGRASDGVTDTVVIQVFASFEDPEVAAYVAQSSNEMKMESINKSRFGVVNDIADTVTGVSDLLEKIPIIGGTIENLASLVMSVLDKPTTSMATQPIQQSYSRDICQGTGLDNSQTLSLYPLTPMSMDRSIMGDQSSTMTINDIISTPMICQQHTFTNPSSTMVEIVHPEANSRDYLQFMSKLFKYWRGSIKYRLAFYTSAFTTCRFRLSFQWDSTVVDDDNSGDLVSRVIDVKGDTVVDFTVPYLYLTLYRPTPLNLANLYPRIFIQQLINVVGPSIDTDPKIYLVMWRSAGEDFRLHQLVARTLPLPGAEDTDFDSIDELSTDEYIAQMDVQSDFKKVFDPLIEGCCFTREHGTVNGENINSLHDILKRYSTHLPNAAIQDPLSSFPDPIIGLGGIDYVARIFKYWRGSRRLKAVVNPEKYGGWLPITMQNGLNGTNAYNGMTGTYVSTWQALEPEVPWYSTVPFAPVNVDAAHFASIDYPEGLYTPIDFVAAIADSARYISAGDDFTFGFLVAPRLSA